MTIYNGENNSCGCSAETRAANSICDTEQQTTQRSVVREKREEGLLPTDWFSSLVEFISEQIPQPKRGPRRQTERLVQHYYDLVMTEVKLNSRDAAQKKLNLYHIRIAKIKRHLGQYTLNGSRLYWLDLFESSRFSLYAIETQGNNLTEENTQVRLNYEFATAAEITAWPRTAIEEYYQRDLRDVEDYFATPIDLASLNIFIQRCGAVPLKGRWDTKTKSYRAASPAYQLRAQENLKQAECIVKLQENNQLAQPYRYSEFGRLYFMGLNLQNCSKELRHAALGHCFSIDISVCSQAWRLYTAEQINPEQSSRWTQSLVRDKTEFRQRVAEILGDTHTHRAKQIITAIGFGADIDSQPWPTGNDQYKLPAIREIINRAEVDLLRESVWFREFITEQQQMNQMIFQAVSAGTARAQMPQCVRDKAGRISRNKVMAYLYQQAEYEYLAGIMEYVIRRFGSEELLLPVHDAVYIRHSINRAELTSALNQLNPYLRVDFTEHWGHFDTEQHCQPEPYRPIFTQEQINEFLQTNGQAA